MPGLIAGIGKERVIHSPAAGNMKNICQIADLVEKDQVIAMVGDTPVKATISGVIRGLIRDGYPVFAGMKIADIDPRAEQKKTVLRSQTRQGVSQGEYWRCCFPAECFREKRKL